MSAYILKKMELSKVDALIDDANIGLALKSNISIIQSLQSNIEAIEKAVYKQIKLRPEFKQLLSVSGIGKILGLTIMLETGSIDRFNKVGNYASYCRCVKSERLSNGKKKGENNRKNGNKYLAWATKAVAHKLARACYHIIKVRCRLM